MRDVEASAEIDCGAADPACHCVLSDAMALLGRKYVLDVVCVVGAHGTVRFGTIEEHLPGASTSTLSARLDELVEAGLLERERYAEIPPRVEYELTDEGTELAERLRPVAEWAVERDAGQDADGTGESAADGTGE